MNLRRAVMVGLIVSLGVAAVLGLTVTVLPASFSSLSWAPRLLWTALSIGLFCLAAFVALLVLERRVWRIAMIVALGLGALGITLDLLLTWVLESWHEPAIMKATALIVLGAIALPWAGALMLARFSGLLRWVPRMVVALVFITAGVIAAIVVGELGSEEWFRAMAALLILTVVGTATVPILHRIRGIDKLATVESTALRMRVTCPRCLLEQVLDVGHGRCGRCHLRISIDIEEPRCPGCNYLLHGLTSPVCPECGRTLAPEEVARPQAALGLQGGDATAVSDGLGV